MFLQPKQADGSDPIYASVHSSNLSMGYEKKIQPFVFNGYSLWFWGTGVVPGRFHQTVSTLAAKISRVSRAKIGQHFTKEEMEHIIGGHGEGDGRGILMAPCRQRDRDKQRKAMQEFKDGPIPESFSGKLVKEGSIWFKSKTSKPTCEESELGKWGWGGYFLLYEEPTFTCGECQHTDYTENNCQEILQATTMAAASGTTCFYIGIDYCLAAKKEYRTRAEEGGGTWRTVKAGRGPDEEWEYTDLFSLPCSPGGATPSVDLGDVRGALEDVLGGGGY